MGRLVFSFASEWPDFRYNSLHDSFRIEVGARSYGVSRAVVPCQVRPSCRRVWGVAMLKPERVGLIVLACGAVVGLIIGGPFGLALATVCLVVGLVLVVTTEAMGTRNKKPDIPTGANQPKSQVLILVKEVHARPQLGGRFQEIRDPDQTDLQFEVFANCWLVNDTDEPL